MKEINESSQEQINWHETQNKKKRKYSPGVLNMICYKSVPDGKKRFKF